MSDRPYFDPRLVVLQDPRCWQAEQYRSFRTNLRANNPAESSTTVLITSAFPDDGKSVTAANIALCLAEVENAKVCLIDADVRVPSQSEMFGMPRSPGLTEVLLDRVEPSRALHRVEFPGLQAEQHLDLMPAGRETDQVHEIMTSDHLPNFLGELKRRYDWVLIDSAPVMAFSDAADIARVVDGTVLVVAIEKTPKREVHETLTRLDRAGANVIGTFVTGTESNQPTPTYLYDGI